MSEQNVQGADEAVDLRGRRHCRDAKSVSERLSRPRSEYAEFDAKAEELLKVFVALHRCIMASPCYPAGCIQLR